MTPQPRDVAQSMIAQFIARALFTCEYFVAMA